MANPPFTITGRIVRFEPCAPAVQAMYRQSLVRLVIECTGDFFSKNSNCAVPGREVSVLLAQSTYDDYRFLLEPGQELSISGMATGPLTHANSADLIAMELTPIARRANLEAADLDRLEKRLASDERSREAASSVLQRIALGSRI